MPAEDFKAFHEMRRPLEDRRRKPDWVVRAVSVISVAGWFLAIVFIALLDNAKPSASNFFSQIFGISRQYDWNRGLLVMALILLCVVFLACLLGFFLNMIRHRRKTDKYNRSVIILGCLSVVGIILFLWQFGVTL